MKKQQKLSKHEILEIAERNNGTFTVNRHSYSASAMRNKLKSMVKDKDCVLEFKSATQKHLTYIVRCQPLTKLIN